MPLLPGKSNIGYNISEMEAAGHPKRVAVAAALSEAYDKRSKKPKRDNDERSRKAKAR